MAPLYKIVQWIKYLIEFFKTFVTQHNTWKQTSIINASGMFRSYLSWGHSFQASMRCSKDNLCAKLNQL